MLVSFRPGKRREVLCRKRELYDSFLFLRKGQNRKGNGKPWFCKEGRKQHEEILLTRCHTLGGEKER